MWSCNSSDFNAQVSGGLVYKGMKHFLHTTSSLLLSSAFVIFVCHISIPGSWGEKWSGEKRVPLPPGQICRKGDAPCLLVPLQGHCWSFSCDLQTYSTYICSVYLLKHLVIFALFQLRCETTKPRHSERLRKLNKSVINVSKNPIWCFFFRIQNRYVFVVPY